MIEVGIISEVRDDRAKVAIGSMVTDFLPVFQAHANSYAVSFSPIRVGEQVLVLPVHDELNSGVVLRGLYQSSHKTDATDKKVHISFEDGIKMSYDSSSSCLEISSPKLINITCDNANVKAKNVIVEASDTTIKSGDIKLLGNTLIEGSINTAGNGGGSGSFEINGDVKITGSITTGGNANFGGSVSDARGSLTDHKNNGLARD
ncbi:phage baseplate assembly protein V [Campylobacter concisus]|jgi:phage-related baseplate assembly protein|uniref:phage baseplate assembly protein V n=1 Tax=Campylobacter concisus TaxID=199 RepID=UPI000D3221AC|nr:phage baseplate assembly protein V [Campylobacter concisus]DAT12236.1 MAG TPA: baseplate assembly protein V [Caudoviricetes sp.]